MSTSLYNIQHYSQRILPHSPAADALATDSRGVNEGEGAGEGDRLLPCRNEKGWVAYAPSINTPRNWSFGIRRVRASRAFWYTWERGKEEAAAAANRQAEASTDSKNLATSTDIRGQTSVSRKMKMLPGTLISIRCTNNISHCPQITLANEANEAICLKYTTQIIWLSNVNESYWKILICK